MIGLDITYLKFEIVFLESVYKKLFPTLKMCGNEARKG